MASEDFADVRLSTPGGISYKRVHGYPTYEEDMTTAHGEDEWIITTADLDALLEELFPHINQPLPDYAAIHTRTLEMPGYDWLRAAKVRITAHDMTRPCNPLNADADADVLPALAETYGNLLRVHIWFEVMSDSPFAETTLSAGSEFLHVAPNMTNVSEDVKGDPITAGYQAGQQQASKANTEPSLGIYKHVPTIIWDYKLKGTPFSRESMVALFQIIGKVNSNAHYAICVGAAPETVMLAGIAATLTYRWYRLTPGPGDNHFDVFDIDFKFAQRCIEETVQGTSCIYGWNHFYMPQEGHWTKLSRKLPDGSKKYMYEAVDFAGYLGLPAGE